MVFWRIHIKKNVLRCRLFPSHSNILADMLHVFPSDHRGIEWISLTGFISFATSTPNNLGLVRNELQLVDLPTGLCFLRNLLQELTDLLGSDKFCLFFKLFFLLSWQNKIIKRSFNCFFFSLWSHKMSFVWCSADRLEPTPLQKHLGLIKRIISVSRGSRSSHTGY